MNNIRPFAIIGCVLLASCFAFVAPAFAQISPAPSPSTAEQYQQAGDQYAAERQYDQAVDAFRQAIKLNPKLAAAYLGLGTAYANMGRLSDALEPMRTAVQLEPGNTLAHLNLGRALAEYRHPDEAIAELNEAKRLSPDNAFVHNEIGNVLHNSYGRIEEALAEYQEARRLNPELPYVQHNVGLMFIRLGRFADAIAPFQEALRLDPQYRNARYFLADAYTKTRQYDLAIDSWSKFLELVPNGPDALTNRSWAYLYEGGHGREAAADARTFLDVHGWQKTTSPYLAIMANLGYREAGMSEEARAILEEASKRIKGNIWPVAVIRYLDGEIKAEELLEQATSNDKKTEAHAYLAMDLLLKGSNDEARSHFAWVKDYGNRQFFEYTLAREELKRLK